MNKSHYLLAIITLTLFVFFGCEKETLEEEILATGLEFAEEDVYAAIPEASGVYAGTFPSSLELPLPPPHSQGTENSCVAFAAAYGVMGFYIGKELGNLMNTDGSVNGHRVGSPEFLFNLAQILCIGSRFVASFPKKGALNILLEDGVCTWASMPYTDNGCSTKPNSSQYENAKNYKISGFERVSDFSQSNVKALLLDGYPIMIACDVDKEFANKDRGTQIWNKTNKDEIAGGHAMVIMGYDDTKSAYKILNSWGTTWADGGYVWLDYSAAPKLIKEAYIVDPLITKPDVIFPTVQTVAISSITKSSALSGGNVTNDGGASVTARGVCWSTITNPTISSNKTTNGSGTGSFSSSLSGLSANTTYYVRAYATNSAGTAYGNQVSFKTENETVVTLPTVQTTTPTDITKNSAISGGTVINDGGATVTARGVCWSTSTNPTISNSKTSNATGVGNFTSSITGLLANTTYYVRAYATNSLGTAYGIQISFKTATGTVGNPNLNPSLTYGSLVDIDGFQYATIKIGFQTWMAENLRTTRYNDGTAIPFVLNHSEWTSLSSGAYTIYDYSPENEPIYGKLYNQYAVLTEKLCPNGWHIPSYEEFEQLRTYLGGSSIAGGKLKATGDKTTGTGLWESPNYMATNESGFSGIPGGYRVAYGYQSPSFRDVDKEGYWWTLDAGLFNLYFNNDDFNHYSYEDSRKGASCRCVKD